MKTNKRLCSCTICKNVLTTNNLPIHYNSKQCRTGKLFSSPREKQERSLKCKFCDKIGSSMNSITQHELYCKSNPEKKVKKSSFGMLGKKGSNQFAKAKKMGLPLPEVSERTRLKISEATKKANETRWADPAIRKKHAEAMRRAVNNNPDSYTSSNRGRVKQIEYKGIKFQGSWELEFYKYCEANSIECFRNTEGFKYVWQGERTYYPDFYLPKYDSYVEVKGYKTERDEAKWKQFPKKLLIIDKKDIDNIKKGIYNLIVVK
jgi:hypothetical protein